MVTGNQFRKCDGILVVGGGSFGTSMASLLATKFHKKNIKVVLKVRSKDTYEALKLGKNEAYLSGMTLQKEIIPVLNWAQVLEEFPDGPSVIVSGLPSNAIKEFFTENWNYFHQLFKKNIPLVCLSKGIDVETLHLPDDIYSEIFPGFEHLFTYLSGPSFASEIVAQQITCVSIAGKSRSTLLYVTDFLQTSYFRPFPTYDIKGVLLGGALKNVLAIAGGILEGLGYNHNTRAAMISRGIEEMLRFGIVFNARPETFYGLSGMGDLILTTTGEGSRNKKFGIEISQGKSANEILANHRHVVEGYKTALAAHKMIKLYEIRAQLFNSVYKILYENVSPKMMVSEMMKTPIKFGDSYLDFSL